MGIVKAISGHTGARGIMRYLERDDRGLARDFLNISAPIEGWEGNLPCYGVCDWAAEMDSVREAAGNGRAWHGRAARTWKHYVLSSDPRSGVDLGTLRELAVAWASEHFPDHQVAIVYHDDNEGRIPHAHVVVNNTSLETGRRLQVPGPLELNRSFQRLEAERGLSHFSNEPMARPVARVRQGRGERAVEARGERSWVAGIRARAGVARALAASPAEYRSLLAAMGIELSDAARRGPRRDWVYTIADHPSRRIRGERLGLDYGRASVCAAIVGGAPPIERRAALRAVREAVSVDGREELGRLADAASTIWRRRARSLEALDLMATTAERAGRTGEAEALKRARGYAAEKGLLPERAERPHAAARRPDGREGPARPDTRRHAGRERGRDERKRAR